MIMSSLAKRQQARQLARRERKCAIQQHSDIEEPLPSFPPLKKEIRDNDPTSHMIVNVLGEFNVVKSSIVKEQPDLIGVDIMPVIPAKTRLSDKDIDTELATIIPTPEKVPCTTTRPSIPISPGFQPPTITHQVKELQGGTFSRKLDTILKDMSVPSPIGQLAQTPERSELNSYLEEAPRNLIGDKPTVSNAKVEIDLNRKKAHGLPIFPPVNTDRPSLHESKRGPSHPRRSLGLDMVPFRPLSPIDNLRIDISQIVNQFKTHKAVSLLGNSEGCKSKKPFANELPTMVNKKNENEIALRSNLNASSDLESKSKTLKNDVKTRKREMVQPLSKNEWIMDRNKTRSIRQVFRKKGKTTSKQEIEQTRGKKNHDAGKCADECHEQCVQTKGKENVPTQVPVIKCSLNLLLIRRLPTSQKTTADKDIDQVVRDGERPLFDKNTNHSDDFCTKTRARDLNADTDMSEIDGEFLNHRKEEKRKRVNSNNSVDEKNSLYLPSQSVAPSNSSVQNGLETDKDRSENVLPYLDIDADQPSRRYERGFPQSGATVESGYQSLHVVASDQEEYQNLQHSPSFLSSYYKRMKMEAEDKPDERNHNDYKNEAKRLKYVADREHDIVLQYIFYVKAAMFFVLAGASMDTDGKQPNKGSQNMYSEANTLIKHVSRKFRPRDSSSRHREVLTVLLILSVKAQAILQLTLYKSKRSEIKEHAKMLNEYFAKKMVPLPSVEVPNGCVKFMSSNSSPSGRVRSADPSSSGGFLPGSQNKDSKHSSQMVMVPVSIHTTLMKNHYNVGLLQASLDLWDQAHQMVLRTSSEDFFIRIEEKFGSLTLHSSIRELARIVNDVLETLGNDYRDYSIFCDVNSPQDDLKNSKYEQSNEQDVTQSI